MPSATLSFRFCSKGMAPRPEDPATAAAGTAAAGAAGAGFGSAAAGAGADTGAASAGCAYETGAGAAAAAGGVPPAASPPADRPHFPASIWASSSSSYFWISHSMSHLPSMFEFCQRFSKWSESMSPMMRTSCPGWLYSRQLSNIMRMSSRISRGVW